MARDDRIAVVSRKEEVGGGVSGRRWRRLRKKSVGMERKNGEGGSRKSVGIGNVKGMPLATPELKRKFERVEVGDTKSPLRRSDRIMESLTSGGSSKSKGWTLKKSRRRKAKRLVEVTMESPEAVYNEEVVGVNRKRINARTFKSFFEKSRSGDVLKAGGDTKLQVESKIVVVDQILTDQCNGGVRGDVGAEARSQCSDSDSRFRETSNDAESLASTPSVAGKEPNVFKTPIRSAGSRDVSVDSESIGERPMASSYPWIKEFREQFGTCSICLKERRVGYDSLEQDLCFCELRVNNHPVGCSPCKDVSDHGVTAGSESAENCECGIGSFEMHGDSPLGSCENACDLCSGDGELLCCKGKGCKSCYHCGCLDPPLSSALPGAWYCSRCVEKKLLFGVHSVSDGVEMICDVREVELPNAKGCLQKKYLVKYLGIAHVHNQWMSERQLWSENPFLISRFAEKSQVVKWNVEWAVPQRLLEKRSINNRIFIASLTEIFVCNNEWLVKWHGLGYDHCTWELENEPFFSSSLGQQLIKDYESRHQNLIPCLVSKFCEYWVPVQMSDYQLELYCAELLSKRIALSSSSKNDSVGALQEIILTAQKCCSHPYLLDLSLLKHSMAQNSTEELVDIGISASGKLQCLDKMLGEVKARGLQVLILYQSIAGSQGAMGEILEDFLSTRFGAKAYEHIGAGVIHSKKQAAINRFNKKEAGKFVFVMETRACTSSIKFSDLDIILIHDSDWNPANDVRTLQKISINSKVESIKVFRLYTSFTVEERALVLSKEGLNIHSNFQTFSRSVSDTLLSWGSSRLFERLDEYHAAENSGLVLDFSSELSNLFLNKVIQEFEGILSDTCQKFDSNPVISKVKLVDGIYVSTITTIGESRVPKGNEEQPHHFWEKLLDGKHPKWKHLKRDSSNSRKRISRKDKWSCDTGTQKDHVMKKRKVMIDGDTKCSLFGLNSFAPKEGGASSDQTNLHNLLQGGLRGLCDSLNLSDDVFQIMKKILSYIINKHHINSDSPPLLHALQISICWLAVSIAKQGIRKRDILRRAKKLLKFKCTEEEAKLVYEKMQSLKDMILRRSGNTSKFGENCLLVEDINNGLQHTNEAANSKTELLEQPIRGTKEKHAVEDEAAENVSDTVAGNVKKSLDRPMKNLTQKHQDEIHEFLLIWEEKRLQMETDHKIEVSGIRLMHGQNAMAMCKIKLLESAFADRMEEHRFLMNMQLTILKEKQLAAVQKARQSECHLPDRDQACVTGSGAAVELPLCSHSEDEVGGPKVSTSNSIDVSSLPRTPPNGENSSMSFDNSSKSFDTRRNEDVGVVSSHPPAYTQDSEPLLVTQDQNCESGAVDISTISDLPVSEHQDQPKTPNGNGETVPENIDAPVPRNHDDLPPEDSMFVLNEAVATGSDEQSEKECTGSLPGIETRIDETGRAVDDGLQTTAQALPHSDPSTHQVAQQNSGELQIRDSSLVINQCSSRLEVSKSGFLDDTVAGSSIPAAPLSDDVGEVPVPATGNSEQPNPGSKSGFLDHIVVGSSIPAATLVDYVVEVPATGNSEQPNPASFAKDQPPPSTENPDRRTAPPQTTEPVRTEALLHVPPSLNYSIDAGHLRGPGAQPSSWNCPQLSSGDLFRIELERMRTETAVLGKNYENMLHKLNYDCEKEIEETTNQIRNKYGLKIQETRAEFSSIRSQRSKNENRIIMNQCLAEAFARKTQPRPISEAVPGARSGSVRQLQQASVPPVRSPQPGPSVGSAGPVAAYPSVQTAPQLRAISARTPLAPNRAPTPAQHPSSLIPSPGIRSSLIINPFTPASLAHNSGKIRSQAPHLQSLGSFRAAAVSAAATPPGQPQTPILRPQHTQPASTNPPPSLNVTPTPVSLNGAAAPPAAGFGSADRRVPVASFSDFNTQNNRRRDGPERSRSSASINPSSSEAVIWLGDE